MRKYNKAHLAAPKKPTKQEMAQAALNAQYPARYLLKLLGARNTRVIINGYRLCNVVRFAGALYFVPVEYTCATVGDISRLNLRRITVEDFTGRNLAAVKGNRIAYYNNSARPANGACYNQYTYDVIYLVKFAPVAIPVYVRKPRKKSENSQG